MRTPENVQRDYSEIKLKALVVHLILDGKVEEALEQLAEHRGVNTPKVKVGLPERHATRALGCYTAKNQTIYVLNSDLLKNPFVILHEFYHHLRTSIDKKHRGTEKYASQFAQEFIQAYENLSAQRSGQ